MERATQDACDDAASVGTFIATPVRSDLARQPMTDDQSDLADHCDDVDNAPLFHCPAGEEDPDDDVPLDNFFPTQAQQRAASTTRKEVCNLLGNQQSGSGCGGGGNVGVSGWVCGG